MANENIRNRLNNSLEVSSRCIQRYRPFAVLRINPIFSQTSRVIDIHSARGQGKLTPRSSRRLIWGLILILVLGVPILFGRTIIRALRSGSAVVMRHQGAAKPVAYLAAPSYCAGLPGGWDEISQLTLSVDSTRLFWIVRRFGGRVMSAGTKVEVLEPGPRITQVRDQETDSICHLASQLLTRR